MSHLTDRKIEALLSEGPTPEPPPELLDKLRQDLPEKLGSAAASPAHDRRPATYRWALAASVLIAVGGGFLGLRVFQETPPTPAMQPESAASSEAPEETPITAQSEPRWTEDSKPAVLEEEAPLFRIVETEIAQNDELATKVKSPRASDLDPGRRLQEMKPMPSPKLPSTDQAAPRPSAPPVARREKDVTFRGGSPRPEKAPPAKMRSDSSSDRAAARAGEESISSARELTARSSSQILPETSAATGTAEVRSRKVQSTLTVAADTSERLQGLGYLSAPEDRTFDQNYYRHVGVNPFVDAEDDPLSTFGLDVDTASYTVVRRYLDDGHLPPPAAVRLEEMINFFDYGDPAPKAGDFALYAEGSPSPFGAPKKNWLLRLHLQAREVDARDRPPADLTFVIDVSGSMQRQNRLELVKKALYLLLDELRPDDRVALVVYGSRGQVILTPTGHLGRIRDGISRLQPGGSTNAEEGLMLAYELASEYGRRGAIQRIILCSDGVANVGRTGAESILASVRRWATQNIELTTVGFGMGNFNDVLMEQLADQGDGRYAYVDDLDEAHRVFVENLTGTLLTIASDARAQVQFDPAIVERYRLIGYENRDMADRDFRNDAVDAGEIGAGHGVTALYELELRHRPSRGDRVATLRLRYRSQSSGEFEEGELQVRGQAFARKWQLASRGFRLSTIVAEFGELLKETSRAREGHLEEVFRRSQELSIEFAGDHEVAEFVALIGRAARLEKRGAD